jgi:16S rRNA (adenine1518-N6/adenine1519-N6)-dimethyltransferase
MRPKRRQLKNHLNPKNKRYLEILIGSLTILMPPSYPQSFSRPKRSLSQNFLSDVSILARIAGCTPLAGRAVVEIGPGRGGLTRAILACRPASLLLLERDDDLADACAQAFSTTEEIQVHGPPLGQVPEAPSMPSAPSTPSSTTPPPQVEVRHVDALDYLDRYATIAYATPGTVLIGNIPYHLSSPLIVQALTCNPGPSELVFCVQREFAERLVSPISTAHTTRPTPPNPLSLLVELSCHAARMAFGIPAGAFFPVPKVDSCVIHLSLRPERELEHQSKLVSLIRAGFSHPRKKLSSNLTQAGYTGVDTSLSATRLDSMVRPHMLSLFDWRALHEALDASL